MFCLIIIYRSGLQRIPHRRYKAFSREAIAEKLLIQLQHKDYRSLPLLKAIFVYLRMPHKMDGIDRYIKFIYNEPAMLVRVRGKDWLAVGDIHIGAERRLSERGINVYDVGSTMADKIIALAKEFDAHGVILLGDLKDSIMYPESWELKQLKAFMSAISAMKLIVLRGNHDGHISELLDVKVQDEFCTPEYAFLHGNKWPSSDAMQRRILITAHNHAAVKIQDSNGAVYPEKAWIVSKANMQISKKLYENPKANVLIVLPSFNPLILGFPAGTERSDKENINPLFRSGVFDYWNSDIYTIKGDYAGKTSSFKGANGRTV